MAGSGAAGAIGTNHGNTGIFIRAGAQYGRGPHNRRFGGQLAPGAAPLAAP